MVNFLEASVARCSFNQLNIFAEAFVDSDASTLPDAVRIAIAAHRKESRAGDPHGEAFERFDRICTISPRQIIRLFPYILDRLLERYESLSSVYQPPANEARTIERFFHKLSDDAMLCQLPIDQLRENLEYYTITANRAPVESFRAEILIMILRNAERVDIQSDEQQIDLFLGALDMMQGLAYKSSRETSMQQDTLNYRGQIERAMQRLLELKIRKTT